MTTTRGSVLFVCGQRQTSDFPTRGDGLGPGLTANFTVYGFLCGRIQSHVLEILDAERACMHEVQFKNPHKFMSYLCTTDKSGHIGMLVQSPRGE